MERKSHEQPSVVRQKESASPAAGHHSAPKRWLAPIVLVVLVAAVTLVVHWPVLHAGAISMDDARYLFENHVLQNPSWTSVKAIFAQILGSTTIEGYYEPLTLVSLMGDVAMGGRSDSLQPFHRTNLALHVLNTALVIVLLCMLFGRALPAALAGLLFAVHPLTVEPVAWVWERKTLLAAFFALWCLIFYVRFVRRPSRGTYVACLAMFVLALLAKPTTTPLPILLLLLDFWPLRRLSRKALWEKVPFLAIAAISAVVTVVSTQRNSGISLPGDYSVAQLPLRICYLLMFYLSKIVWPVRLSSIYVLPEPLALSNPLVLVAVIGTIAAAAVLLVSLRWTRSLLSGGLIFALMISPTLGVIGYSWVSASDKYVYLPAIGLLLLLTSLIARLFGDSRRPRHVTVPRVAVVTFVVALTAAEASATRRNIQHWRDSLTLAQYLVAMAPVSPYAHNALGDAFFDLKRHDEAAACYGRAIQLSGGLAIPHNSLAVVLDRMGRTDEAMEQLHTALRLNPNYPDAHRNLAVLLARQGRNREAIEHFSASLQLKPDEPEAQNHLAVLLMSEGMPGRAIAHFKAALRIKPNSPGIMRNLAWILATTPDPGLWKPAEAVRLAERACALGAVQEPAALDTLAAAYAAAGRFDRAIPTAQKALELARTGGKITLAEGIGERLKLYTLGLPYRETLRH